MFVIGGGFGWVIGTWGGFSFGVWIGLLLSWCVCEGLEVSLFSSIGVGCYIWISDINNINLF